ncbi:MAG: hypothetical protein V1874_07200 [Spirochaetota bacterium]
MLLRIVYHFYKMKLIKYNGFNYELYQTWFRECPLSFFTKIKILNSISIVSNYEIRELIRNYYNSNKEIFDQFDYFISLGDAGKSGDIILYELRHGIRIQSTKFIRIDEMLKSKTDANILFIDDLIGTGRQSVRYINEKVSQVITSKTRFCILTLFSTVEGSHKVDSETNVDQIFTINTITDDWNIFHNSSNIFSSNEKQKIGIINDLLSSEHDDYNRGLLLAFSYGVPNNSVRLLWKHNYKYKLHGIEKKWFALLPRNY